MTDSTPAMQPTERFLEAMALASQLHANQRRKGSDTPYLAHLLAVTALVLEHGGTEDEAIAALLHDAVEDQGGRPTLEAIRARFGDHIAATVSGLTDTDEIHKPSWRPRKERYIAHLRTAPYSVRLIAAADKLHNARSVRNDYRARGESVWNTFTGGRDGTLWFYPAVLDALQSAATPHEARLNALLEELAVVVNDLEIAAHQHRPTETAGT
ncbi:MAG: HD domain-containing protein [Thermomicrobiales bacterium]